MGVGVFTSDFSGTGTTFNVAGPLAEDKDFEAYRKEVDDPVDRETWAQDEYDDFVETMEQTIEEAARELGFSIGGGRGGRAPRAGFDSDFVGGASNDVVEIGWRSWEHDFVVGVGPDGHWKDWLTGDDEDFLLTKGRPVDAARTEYDDLVAAVSEYVRIALMERGVECRFRTGSYTSDAYVSVEDVVGRQDALLGIIRTLTASLTMEASTRIKNAGSEERVALLKAVHDGRIVDMRIAVPFYDAEDDAVLLWQVGRNEPLLSVHGSPELMEHARSQPREKDLAPLAWNELTKLVFESFLRGRAGDTLIVTADEYGVATGEALSVTYLNAKDDEITVEFAGPPTAAEGIAP